MPLSFLLCCHSFHRLRVQFVAFSVAFGTELLAASCTALSVIDAKKRLGGACLAEAALTDVHVCVSKPLFSARG